MSGAYSAWCVSVVWCLCCMVHRCLVHRVHGVQVAEQFGVWDNKKGVYGAWRREQMSHSCMVHMLHDIWYNICFESVSKKSENVVAWLCVSQLSHAPVSLGVSGF